MCFVVLVECVFSVFHVCLGARRYVFALGVLGRLVKNYSVLLFCFLFSRLKFGEGGILAPTAGDGTMKIDALVEVFGI